MMSRDLVLRPSCSGCGSSSDLYGSNCKNMTLCISCGKSMAEKKAKCSDCGATITRLIREYSVRANTGDDKIYFIGKFSTGLPKFSRKKKNNWSLCKNKRKDGRRDNLQYLFKEPWVLEDETGKARYQGDFEEQSAAYYLLVKQGKEITAIPSGSWFNFNKVAQYKQLTLEEAEEKMNSRKKTQDGYERWMMKASINGASAFSKVEKFGSKENKNKTGGDDDEGNFSDKGDEDEEEEGARKNRLRLKKKVVVMKVKVEMTTYMMMRMMVTVRRVMTGSMKKFSAMMMKTILRKQKTLHPRFQLHQNLSRMMGKMIIMKRRADSANLEKS